MISPFHDFIVFMKDFLFICWCLWITFSVIRINIAQHAAMDVFKAIKEEIDDIRYKTRKL